MELMAKRGASSARSKTSLELDRRRVVLVSDLPLATHLLKAQRQADGEVLLGIEPEQRVGIGHRLARLPWRADPKDLGTSSRASRSSGAEIMGHLRPTIDFRPNGQHLG